MKIYDFVIIGGGIFGAATAVELAQRRHTVALLNPDEIPHPLAASTDISKVVRMEYGTDVEYMRMVEECITGWRAWNEQFNEVVYHETGFLLICRRSMDSPGQAYEHSSYQNLLARGHKPERLDAAAIERRFPGVNSKNYVDGFYNPVAGFAEAARVVEKLVEAAARLGSDIFPGQTAAELLEDGGGITGVRTREGGAFAAGHTIVCAGPYTPYLVPELQPYFRITGHPVFHLKPSRPELFTVPNLPVFAADISNTGWYGFPMHPREGVVKIANHGIGLELHPEHDPRVVTEADTRDFRQFLRETFPALADDPIMYTRRCVYTDTHDGHFWIDRHPEKRGLTIGTGGSGHGLKMAPLLGRLIANAALGQEDEWLHKFRWRVVQPRPAGEEEARHQPRGPSGD